MAKNNPVKDKTLLFSLLIIEVYNYLVKEKKEFILSKQLLRSGTAIGALYREAEFAESAKDFIHKMSIAQKETNETLYWIELLRKSNYLENLKFQHLEQNTEELIKILTSIIRTSKTKLK